ncbi:MAG: YqgE/AlgH family protein [Gammaproteobacteria bacterium]|nr:YqgE/AlgH family protein [Gammaproteobacteria bacterium]
MEKSSLNDQFLIAMPALRDPNFEQTVTLICQHNQDGALGIVINRTINLTVGEVLAQMDLPSEYFNDADTPVHYGGPVQSERGFILHRDIGNWQSTLAINEEIGLTTSRDILEAMAANEGPKHSLLALGYAGWGSGQLEYELGENAWLSGPADYDVIFSTPVGDRWHAAAKLLGVDLHVLSPETGHA